MATELTRRIAFTLGALLIYRLGTYIPLPGIDPAVWSEMFRRTAGGLLGSINLLSGGGLHRLAIFALGIVPYVTAAYILQLASIFSRRLRALRGRGERGRTIIKRCTLILTLLLAAFQSYGIAVALEGIPGLTTDPGALFVVTTMVTLAGGTLVLAWLSEQITVRGIGNGIAWLLFTGFATEAPIMVANTLGLGTRGQPSGGFLAAMVALAVAATAFVVWMEKARLAIAVRYPRREVAGRTLDERSCALSLKINNAGVMPVIIASWLLLALALLAILGAGGGRDWLTDMAEALRSGRPLYLVLYGLLIFLSTFFYAALVLDPDEAAATLARQGGALEGVEPGEATAAHLDHVVSRITAMGAAYLALVFLLPELLVAWAGVPFYLGGMSLLVAVCTVLDIEAQVRGMMRSAPVAGTF